MALSSGQRLGLYEIVAPLGAGGMGEVYRATDSRLSRDVALKVLPNALASDPDRAARFKREAQVLASLNHPNVAAIYGLEEAPTTPGESAVRALVMELVDGLTLADRLSEGPMPLEEIIEVARQIAEAVEYAHEQGVIHRDLKPANIKITSAGVVKVLDFGLAKALDQGSGVRPQGTGAVDAAVPTLSIAATQAGLILGTAAYMSPEQAKGKPADRRADIWSFGIVLFEMLAGRAVYSGETVSETMALVMTKEPDWTALPPTTPPRLRELLRRCLVKDPRNRLQAIGEARIALQQQTETESGASGSTVGSSGGTRSRPRLREWIWASIAILSLLVAAALAARQRFASPPPPETMRFELVTPGRGAPPYPQGSASISPDGRKIAYVALSGSRPLLWVHSFDTGTAQALESTEGIAPSILMWSPDGQQIAFSAEGRLKRVAAGGGPSQVICVLPENAITGAWGADNVILIGSRAGIQRTFATGGDIVPIATGEHAQETHRFPSFLPDGRHYFYLATQPSDAPAVAYVGAIDSAERRPLAGIRSEVKYSSSGHVLFLRDAALMAQRFDVARLELVGEPFLVIDRFTAPNAVAGPFSTSLTGTLAFRQALARPDSQLVWLDRSGKQLGVASPPNRYADIELSSDDKLVAFEAVPNLGGSSLAGGPRVGDIWALDLATGVASRVTSDPDREADPVWSPDGKSVAFRSDRDGGHLYQRALGGLGEDALIFKGKTRESPDHFSPDGAYLVFTADPEGDVWALPLSGDRRPVPVATSRFRESDGRVAPGGQLIAYVSNESGRNEIYVQSFPKAIVKQQVSSAGGEMPRWSHDGRELYYVAPEQNMMAVAIRSTGESLNVGPPTRLFQARGTTFGEGEYAVSSTGRFLVNMPMAEITTPPITVILNWAASLRR